MFVKIISIPGAVARIQLEHMGVRVGHVYEFTRDGEGTVLQSRGRKWNKRFAHEYLLKNVTMEEVAGWPERPSVLPREYLRDVYREHLLKYGEADAKHAVECIVQAQKDGVF